MRELLATKLVNAVKAAAQAGVAAFLALVGSASIDVFDLAALKALVVSAIAAGLSAAYQVLYDSLAPSRLNRQ